MPSVPQAKWLCIASLLAMGCQANAVLELDLILPELPAGSGQPCNPEPCGPGTVCGGSNVCVARGFVLVQPRNAFEFPFDAIWPGPDLEALQLLEAGQLTDSISVVSETFDVDLGLKVRFCTTPTCSDPQDVAAPEEQFLLRRPFYPGKRTFLAIEILAVPVVTNEATVVGRCTIRGCTGETLASFCRADGSHLCE